MELEENPAAFKHLIGKDLLGRMGSAIQSAEPAFDIRALSTITPQLEALELKPRVRLIRDQLHRLLPDAYPKALAILMRSLGAQTLTGFDLWPYTEFIQTYGLEHCELSLQALSELTVLFTGEFAVRPFLIRYPEQTLAFLTRCASSPNHHLRRWSSEGTRPRLPWGEKLPAFIQDPAPAIRILDLLKTDPELYVRKSVANHLNDITKDNPDAAIATLKRWKKQCTASPDDTVKIDWITRHALRTLIKAGHPEALSLIGVSTESQTRVSGFSLNRSRYVIGDTIEFEFEIRSRSAEPQKLVIDYIVHYQRSGGKLSPKVFKLKTFTLTGYDSLRIHKSHPLRPVTTRRLYPGAHRLEIQVNGQVVAGEDWVLGE